MTTGSSLTWLRAERALTGFMWCGWANAVWTRCAAGFRLEQTGRRGRCDAPLYTARKLLAKGDECLNDNGWVKLFEALRVGDPHDEVPGAWLAKEAVRAVYLTDETTVIVRASHQSVR